MIGAFQTFGQNVQLQRVNMHMRFQHLHLRNIYLLRDLWGMPGLWHFEVISCLHCTYFIVLVFSIQTSFTWLMLHSDTHMARSFRLMYWINEWHKYFRSKSYHIIDLLRCFEEQTCLLLRIILRFLSLRGSAGVYSIRLWSKMTFKEDLYWKKLRVCIYLLYLNTILS